MKRLISLFVVFIFMTACMSSPRRHYYQLHIEKTRTDAAAQKKVRKLSDKIILIEDVEVEDIYNDYRIVYRTSPYELNYYSYNFWIKRPGKLVRDAIYDYLSIGGFFARVILTFLEGEPDYLLKAKVDVLEEYDLKTVWYAHLKMSIQVTDFKSGDTILFHRFDRRKQLLEKELERLPAAISTIIKEEVVKVVAQLHMKLGQ